MGFENLVQRLVSALSPYFLRVPESSRFTITQTRPNIVVGTMGEGSRARRGVSIRVGNEAEYVAGEVYEVLYSGDPTNPQARLGGKLASRNAPRGTNKYAPVPIPVISVVVNPDDGNPIGLGTAEDLDSAHGYNDAPFALIHAFYRAIVPGSYSVWKEEVTQAVVEYKYPAELAWRQGGSYEIPKNQRRVYLAAELAADGTSVAIGLEATELADVYPGFYVHWRCQGEIMIGKVEYVAAVLTLTILSRAVESTDPAIHPLYASLELLTGRATVSAAAPGVATDVRVAFRSSKGLGFPSVANTLTTWKRLTIPALSADQFHVEMLSNGFHLYWVRPLDPDSDPPDMPWTGRLTFSIWRNTTNSLSGAKQVVDHTSAFDVDIPATLWDTAATQATAYWFGIQVIDPFGNESAILWDKDDEPPPSPDESNVTFVPTSSGLIAHVTDDDSLNDRGFLRYVLWSATDTSGTGQAIVARFGAHATEMVYNFNPFDAIRCYQVTSEDYAGNVGSPTTGAAWKYTKAMYLGQTQPPNGDFQLPNNDLSLPLYWTFSEDTPNALELSYAQGAGLTGDRVVQLVKKAGLGGSESSTVQSTAIGPYTSVLPWAVSFWIYSVDASVSIDIDIAIDGWQDEAGTVAGYPSSLTHTFTIDPIPTGAWTRYSTTLSVGLVSPPTARYGQFRLRFRPHASQGADHTIYLDNVLITPG